MPTAKERLQEASNSWARESKKRSLSPGERIRLFCRISKEAAKFGSGKDAVSQEEIKEAFGKVYTTPTSADPINRSAISKYMKLSTLPTKVIDKLVQHSSPAGWAGLSVSHAVLLANITDEVKQRKLLGQAISERWSVRDLKKATKTNVDNAPGRAPVRHKVLIIKIDTAAADLNRLLTDFVHESFLATIERSDRRSKKETVEALNRIDSLLKEISTKVEKAREVSRTAAGKLKKAIQ